MVVNSSDIHKEAAIYFESPLLYGSLCYILSRVYTFEVTLDFLAVRKLVYECFWGDDPVSNRCTKLGPSANSPCVEMALGELNFTYSRKWLMSWRPLHQTVSFSCWSLVLNVVTLVVRPINITPPINIIVPHKCHSASHKCHSSP